MLVSGKAIGIRSFIDGAIRISGLFSDESERGWAAHVVGTVVVGATAYLILTLSSTIPKTIGRQIRASLIKVEDGATEQELFVNAHAGRVSRETRKVLRITSWDLRERLRGAMETRGKEVRNAEELEKNARKALDYLHDVERRTGLFATMLVWPRYGKPNTM